MSEPARVSFTPPPLREEVGRQESSQQEASHLRADSAARKSTKTRTPRSADFNALVRPLEDLHPAWRLRDPGLGWCIAMHHEDPERFGQCVEYVIEAWNEGSSEKPLGLLCELAYEWLEDE